VGNRATGDRPSQNLDPGQLAIKAALVLGSPYTAMLFMGEEWASSRPFQFFTSHPEPDIARATAEGRKAEFAAHGWEADEVPDPQDPQTFLRSKLDWDEPGRPGHAEMRAFYRELIRLRRTEADLADPWLNHLGIEFDEEQRWIVLRRGAVAIACNLGQDAVSVPVAGLLLLDWGAPKPRPDATLLPGHSVAVLRSAGQRA
jgi:maltooligosyltrehalose trehalohydrolase